MTFTIDAIKDDDSEIKIDKHVVANVVNQIFSNTGEQLSSISLD